MYHFSGERLLVMSLLPRIKCMILTLYPGWIISDMVFLNVPASSQDWELYDTCANTKHSSAINHDEVSSWRVWRGSNDWTYMWDAFEAVFLSMHKNIPSINTKGYLEITRFKHTFEKGKYENCRWHWRFVTASGSTEHVNPWKAPW
jgi:hypothetical protein